VETIVEEEVEDRRVVVGWAEEVRRGMSRSCPSRSRRRSEGSRIVLKRDEQSFRVYSNTVTAGSYLLKAGRPQLGALPPFGEGMSPQAQIFQHPNSGSGTLRIGFK
jgi:hypothetical protein